MPNLTMTFLYMEREHVGKDVTCVPDYLGRALGCKVEIVSLTSATNRDFPVELDGIRYRFLFRRGDRGNGWYKLVFFWWYLIRHAKKIDILMRFHYSVQTVIEAILYKVFNPRGKVYVKCDTNQHIIEKFPNSSSWGWNPGEWVRRCLYRMAIRKIDVISCETMEAFHTMSESSSPYLAFGDKLVFAPNGFDERLRSRLGVIPKPFPEKENIMLTVGRLGTEEKNTEMLLKALEKLELQDWKFYFIGSVEPHFKIEIDRFFKTHPDKKDSLIFTGAIFDKRTLWEYYNRAKVFVLTSRWESYGLVLNEAKRFGCYLVSTEVGAAHDLIEGKYGEFIKQEDFAHLQDVLQHIIDGKTVVDVYNNSDLQELSWQSVLCPVIERLKK